MRRLALLAGVVAAIGSIAVGGASAADFTPGASGAGDPYYPNAGNGGYNVSSYDLTLDWQPTGNQLTATAVISATATQDLSRFNLDLRDFAITRLLVDGRPATFARDGEQELVITPRSGIASGRGFTVTIDYSGQPSVVRDPDGSIEGWVPTDDGAFVVGEPQGSPGWYPVNDTPKDKAKYRFRVTVPAGLTAVANGVLESSNTSNGKTTWVWNNAELMAPYLATSTIGKFDLTISKIGNIDSYLAIDPQLPTGNVFRLMPEIVHFYESRYGQYPFAAVGGIADSAKNVGYSLETQTKPIYDRMPDELTVAHELSHMWYGDAITLTGWNEIWLHEGFATFSEWIWSEYTGNKTAQKYFDNLYNTPPQDTLFWTPPPGNPGSAAFVFNGTIYYRGGMTLQALRAKIGDFMFFTLMRRFVQENRYGNVTTPQFIAMAEQISGRQLDTFFDVWLYQPAKPTSW